MRYLPRSVIALSMTVVAPAVAANSAWAQSGYPDSQGANAYPSPTVTYTPVAAPAPAVPDEAVPDEAAAAPSDGDAQPSRKRKRKAVETSTEAPASSSSGRFGGPAERSHRLQVGLSLMPGTGYRLVVRYNENQSCNDSSGIAGKPVCSRRLPTFLDFQLSFGAMERMDAIVDLRFGLEEDHAATHQFAFAPGLRFWLDREVAFKFYTTLQFVYDYTYFPPGMSTPSSDFGMRNANGLMYDPIRNVGFFVQFGETLGFRRWFRIDLEAGVGAQIRFP